MNKRTAVIIGASGLTGSHCLDYLLESDHYEKVIAVLRKSIKKEHSKLIQIVVNFDEIENYKPAIQGEDIYCAIGTTFLKTPNKQDYYRIDYTYPNQIAKIALANGARNFALISAMSANPNGLFFYSRVKGKLEQSLKQLPFKGLYIFRPSYLLGHRTEFRPIEKIGQFLLGLFKPLLLGPLKKYKAIEAQAVAYAMVNKTLEGNPGVHIYESDVIQKIYDQRLNHK